jgi:type II secretory pathway pseudopilin PulG
MKSIRAFTLIELLVVLGILMASSFILIPIAVEQIQGNKTFSELKILYSNISSQQQNSFSGLNNTSYGIALFSDRYELFIGETLATASSTEEILLKNNVQITSINLTSGNEISFPKGSVKPMAVGEITLSDGIENYQLSINKEGLIEYAKL